MVIVVPRDVHHAIEQLSLKEQSGQTLEVGQGIAECPECQLERIAVEDQCRLPIGPVAADQMFEAHHQPFQHRPHRRRVHLPGRPLERREDAVRLAQVQIGETDVANVMKLGRHPDLLDE